MHINTLEQKLVNLANLPNLAQQDLIVTNMRHYEALKEALEDNLTSVLFVRLLQANAVPISSGGGGGANKYLPWRDKDENYRVWTRRCSHFSKSKLGIHTKRGRRI